VHSSTSVEQRIDERARRFLATAAVGGAKAKLTEFAVFGLKQGWACIFGAALLAVLMAARLWYPGTAGLARNDFLTVAAVAIQILMVAFKLETLRELRVIVLFHLVGTVMELFKTDMGSWSYEAEGVLRIGAVPLFSGFMYAAVGSYMVRVYRLFDLKFATTPGAGSPPSSQPPSTPTSSPTTTSGTCAGCCLPPSWSFLAGA
jgi:uncharacterized membrane protein YoaT (DUF817 family)